MNTGRVPVTLYDADENNLPVLNWIPFSMRGNSIVREYVKRARNILRHVFYQGSGSGSGVHGLYHKFVFLSPAIFLISQSPGIALTR